MTYFQNNTKTLLCYKALTKLEVVGGVVQAVHLGDDS